MLEEKEGRHTHQKLLAEAASLGVQYSLGSGAVWPVQLYSNVNVTPYSCALPLT